MMILCHKWKYLEITLLYICTAKIVVIDTYFCSRIGGNMWQIIERKQCQCFNVIIIHRNSNRWQSI